MIKVVPRFFITCWGDENSPEGERGRCFPGQRLYHHKGAFDEDHDYHDDNNGDGEGDDRDVTSWSKTSSPFSYWIGSIPVDDENIVDLETNLHLMLIRKYDTQSFHPGRFCALCKRGQKSVSLHNQQRGTGIQDRWDTFNIINQSKKM